MSHLLQSGFQRPPQDAAMAFRAAMRAMARPGQIMKIGGAEGPAPLSMAAATLLLTLCDPETPIYLAPGHDGPDIREWLTFHTGAPLVAPPKAMFALGVWDALAPAEAYAVGTPEYPDRSATLIVEMPSLSATGAELRGPGIKDTARLNHPDCDFAQANRAMFPLGCDMFLTNGDCIAAVPRTTEMRSCM